MKIDNLIELYLNSGMLMPYYLYIKFVTKTIA